MHTLYNLHELICLKAIDESGCYNLMLNLLNMSAVYVHCGIWVSLCINKIIEEFFRKLKKENYDEEICNGRYVREEATIYRN